MSPQPQRKNQHIHKSTGRPIPYLAILCLVGLAAIWGYNWVVMKVGVRFAEPFAFAAMRAVLSAAFLFPVIAALHRPMRLQAPLFTTIIGILQTTGFVGLITWALEQGAADGRRCWSTPCPSGCFSWPGCSWASESVGSNGRR
jgi:hypothetical protein